jgi:DNA-binding response OmpR family regulator
MRGLAYSITMRRFSQSNVRDDYSCLPHTYEWMEPSPTSAGRTRVLVCEDADDTRFLLGEMLRACGFEVLEASSGTAAVEVALSGAIDVALIDIGLPDVDGHEVARRIRRGTNGLRLIALTGFGTIADRESSRQSGFDRHLLKPVKIDDLLAAIGATRTCDPPSG